MQLHANAKLGPAGRRELVRRIEDGDTLRAAAAALNVAPATARDCLLARPSLKEGWSGGCGRPNGSDARS